VQQAAFSPLQHDFADADLSEQDDAHDFSHDFEDASVVLLSAFTSFVSAAFLVSSFLGSLSKLTISIWVEEAMRFCTLSAPKATKPKIASDKTSFFILLNL